MNGYRRGAVFGLTVAEIFILLTFLLLIALLGLIQEEETLLQPDTLSAPRVWVRPEEIQTLVNAAKEASKAQEESELARVAAERERDQAQEKVEEARKTQEESELARSAAERERDQARRDLTLLHRKGENPPCWYKTVSVGNGKTRERRHYVFNVAIYEDSIELAPRVAPPGGAFDDGGDDLFQQTNQRLIICGHLGQRRAPALHFADDRETQAMESAHRYALRRVTVEPLADPLLHFLAGVPCISHQQQFRRTPVASVQQPARFGHDHRSLAAASGSDDQVSVIIDDDCLALLLGERP